MEYGRRISVLAFLLFMSFAAAAQSGGKNTIVCWKIDKTYKGIVNG